MRILIEDDGPGFTQEALESYGVRRVSRIIEDKGTGRLSVGLGSVIMKTIASAHHGQVSVRNRPEGGACVEISLGVDVASDVWHG